MRAKPSLALTSVLLALAALSSPADAACKKFGFTVNDYGKDGPTNDAKNLLDKHVAEWAAQNGVKEYQTGKKSVSCELFLDVILFDEHTCTASATVCWGDGVKPNNKTGQQSAAATEQPAAGEESGDHPPAPMRKAEAMGVASQQAAAAAPAADAAAPATAAAEEAQPAAPVAPVEQAAAPAETPPAIPAVQTTAPAAPTPPPTGAAVETGALQAGAGMAAQPAASKSSAPIVPEKDRAAAAAAAASAAAAAERAAVAAETAANAAKEAAAAAVAASAASKGTAAVPPLDHASTSGKPAHNE